MKIKFWGVRGSIPCPGPNTVKYGGNTLCLELRFEDSDKIVIVDAGTGLRDLGDYMMSHDHTSGPMEADIFLTHTHWDHIQGFPFFTPIYVPQTTLRVYGPVTYEEKSLKEVVGGQWMYRYFPVRQDELSSKIEYIDLKECTFDLGSGIKITTKYLNHPLLCLGYRFEHRDRVFCTAFDTEPFQNLFSNDPDDPAYDEAVIEEADLAAKEENERVDRFFSGADLLVHDTQYTEEEYESSKVGWGHSSIEYAVAAAKRSGVKRLALFHHEPVRTDAQIDELSKKYCDPDYSGDVEVFFAREGTEIEL